MMATDRELVEQVRHGEREVYEQILRQELLDAIMEAIEALPARDREVVQARIDGLSHMEISERFGISVQASISRLYRARRKLADHVKYLLSVIFGLPKSLPLRKLISGGVMAMKIATSTKITMGIIGIIAAGLAGFLITTHQLGVTKAGMDVTKTGERSVAAKIEQGGASVTDKTSVASSHQHFDEQDVSDRDRQEAWDALMEALDEMEESADTETEGTHPDTSKTALSEAVNSGTSISPELEAVFTVVKDYRDRIRVLYQERDSFMREYAPLSHRESEINHAINGTSGAENRRLHEELQQVQDAKQKLADIIDPIGEESDGIRQELEQYLQANHGMISRQFYDTYGEAFDAWRNAQRSPPFWAL